MSKIVKDVTFLHLQQQDFECHLLPSKQCPTEGVMRNFASLVPMLENGLTRAGQHGEQGNAMTPSLIAYVYP